MIGFRRIAMNPCSIDLRQRIVDALANGESRSTAAKRFNVSCGTAKNYPLRAAQGALEPRKNEMRALRKFTPESLEALKAWVNEKNDLALAQMQVRLREQFGVEVDPVPIWDRPNAMNPIWKKRRTPPGRNALTFRNSESNGRPKWPIRPWNGSFSLTKATLPPPWPAFAAGGRAASG